MPVAALVLTWMLLALSVHGSGAAKSLLLCWLLRLQGLLLLLQKKLLALCFKLPPNEPPASVAAWLDMMDAAAMARNNVRYLR